MWFKQVISNVLLLSVGLKMHSFGAKNYKIKKKVQSDIDKVPTFMQIVINKIRNKKWIYYIIVITSLF